jgi:4-amino-4-deoxy-L-arabinose transferase-like glycosyltransferase
LRTADRAREVARRHGGAFALVGLTLVLLLAFGLRIEAALTPISDPGTDSRTYAALAEGLYEGGSYEGEGVPRPSDWSPGAPLVFAGVYLVTGGADLRAALLAIALLGTATVLLVSLLARRLVGLGSAGTAAGLLAALAAAVYPTFLDGTGRLLSEPLAGFLLAAAMLAFLSAAESARRARWGITGLLLGALVLTRAEYLPFAPVFALVALTLVWRREGRRRGAVCATLVLAGAVVVVAPWTIRNALVLDRAVPVSTGGGKALFIGTYLPGEGQQVPTKERLIELYGPAPTETLLDRVADRHPELDRDRALARIGRENLERYATEQPGAYARMLLEKAGLVWYRGSSPAAAPVGWVWMHRFVLLLALVGLAILALRRRFEVVLLGLPLVGVTALGALLLAVPRRNVPLMPLVFALAGAAAVWLALAVRERTRRTAAERV